MAKYLVRIHAEREPEDRKTLNLSKELSANANLSHYRIVSKIGAGGMGVVYLAQDTKLDRRVALKILSEEFAQDAERMRRFVQEAKAASALNHPNIITIYEIEEIDSLNFIATEYIDGETLRECMRRSAMKLSDALDVTAQVASALAAAHTAGIVHRDVKPENIMLRRDGIVKVLDFGLAKLISDDFGVVDTQTPTRFKTDPGTIVGTVVYMSPEQARGLDVDARTDIFSLGVVLYEMAAGCLPFAGSTSSDVLASILSEREPQPLARYSRETPAELERIVSKALRKNREERYQTIKDLLLDLLSLKQELEFERKLVRSAPLKSKSMPEMGEQADARTVLESAPRSTVSERGPATPAKISQRRAVVAVAALLVVASAAGAYFYFTIKRGGAINSVAVMPFVNESGDANFDYLSDGLSELVIDRLAQLPQLKVIARNSSFKYRGPDLDLQKVANALDVQAIVTGRVGQRGDNLSVRVEMIDVRDNRQVWSDSYNRRATDLQAVQGEIAQTVSEKLRMRLTGAQEQQLAKTATANPEAYQLYLTGLFVSRTSLKKALDYFTQTILDPNFAFAFYRVSSCYFYLGYNSDLDPKETAPKARAALRKALELDDTLAEAHALMAEIKRSEWDWTGAENESSRVLELNPNTAVAHRIKAGRLAAAGRIEEAVIESRRAQELDPLEIPPRIFEGVIFFHARRFDEAIARFQQIVKLAPDNTFAHEWLGYAYAANGMYREAISEYQQSINIQGENTSDRCSLGHALAKSGKPSEALAILNKLKTAKEYVSPTELVVLYIGLGDKNAAFQSLEKAYAARDLQLQNLKSDPIFDDLRDDPRFADLTRRVGLPQ